MVVFEAGEEGVTRRTCRAFDGGWFCDGRDWPAPMSRFVQSSGSSQLGGRIETTCNSSNVSHVRVRCVSSGIGNRDMRGGRDKCARHPGLSPRHAIPQEYINRGDLAQLELINSSGSPGATTWLSWSTVAGVVSLQSSGPSLWLSFASCLWRSQCLVHSATARWTWCYCHGEIYLKALSGACVRDPGCLAGLCAREISVSVDVELEAPVTCVLCYLKTF